MRVYLSVDLEGIGGVVHSAQLEPGSNEFSTVQQWAAQEVMAVIAGAREAGATEFWVKDVHGDGITLPWHNFPEYVQLVSGRTQPIRYPGLDSSFAALFLIGYHARAGAPDALFAHTWDDSSRYWLNGQEVGQIAIDAAIAGSFGVPVALVTGDDKTTGEAKQFLGKVETVTVKEAITSQGAVLHAHADVLHRAEAGGLKAIEHVRAGHYSPYKLAAPYHFKREWLDAEGKACCEDAEGDDLRNVICRVLGQS